MKLVALLYFSFLFTTVLVLLFMKVATRLGIMLDQPNSRKVHREPIPRTGGPAVIVGALLPMIVLYKGDEVILGLCLGSVCILVTGIIDDLLNLNYKWKFFGQSLAAIVTLLISGIRLHTFGQVWQGFPLDFGLLSLPLSISFLVATTNMINLSDGLDGLAGGICFLIFSAVGFLAYFQDDWRLVYLCLCILGAISGFLRYNNHPAVVFMGDTGSQFLGFTAGISLLLLTQARTAYSPFIPLYLIGIPLIDTTMVIFERLRQGRPIFKADKSHIHHKLLRLGLRHNESVMVIYALQLGMILVALTGRYADGAVLLVSFVCLTGLSIYLFGLGLRIPGVLNSANRNSNLTTGNVRRNDSRIFSSKMISIMTWYGLTCILILFYFISPLLLGLVPKAVGLFSFCMIVCLLLFNRLNNSYVSLILMISFYFLGFYYVFFTEYSQISFYTPFQYRIHYNVLFSILGMSYIIHVISTRKSISFTTNDFLMLMVVIFLFFLPRDYIWTNHIRSIAVKSFLIFICIELVFERLKTKINFTLPPAILALGLNAFVSFLPFII